VINVENKVQLQKMTAQGKKDKFVQSWSSIPGHRKEFFIAEKDMWEVVKRIVIQRKKKELEPILRLLNEVGDVDPTDSEDAEEFAKVIKDLQLYSNKVDSTLDRLINADSNWFVGTFMKMIR